MREYGSDMSVGRQKRKSFGFKADRIHRSVLVDGGTAKPGGTLNIMLSKINNEPIVPGSLYVSFKAKPTSTSDKPAYFVQNLGRAIVTEKQLKFNGKPTTVVNEHDEYKLYADLWLTKAERKSRILQGIQESLGLKHRIGAKKAAAGGDLENVTDEQKAIAKAYGNTFYIPLDDELFVDVTPFCPYLINDNVTIEMKLAEAKDVVLSSDKNASYELSDLHLEWCGIQEHGILVNNVLIYPWQESIAALYQTGLGVHYDRVQFLRKENYQKSSTLINVHIRENVRSLRGVLILFKDSTDQTKYACNRESFYNPGIEKVEVSINGASNKLYASGITPKDLWYEARKFFQGSTNMTQGSFYDDNFCLWVDTRSSTDPKLHGNGLRLDGSNSGLNLSINKASGGSGQFTMYIYLIVDAVLEFGGSSYKRICYALKSCEDGDGDQ